MSFSFEQVAALKKGEIIWENHQYGCFEYEVMEDPVVTDVTGEYSEPGEKRCEFKGKSVKSGNVVEFGVNSRYMHYGPRLAYQNEYITREAILKAMEAKQNGE